MLEVLGFEGGDNVLNPFFESKFQSAPDSNLVTSSIVGPRLGAYNLYIYIHIYIHMYVDKLVIEFRDEGLGFRVSGFEVRVEDLGLKA